MSKSTQHLKRLHVLYKGRVQGIGFRYKAEGIALDIGVNGFVRNLVNGDVEIIAEGGEPKLELLIKNIGESDLGRHIQKSIIEWEAYTGEFEDFRVEFC